MRRGSFVWTGQPVRNMWVNPSFETQGSITTAHTNYALNPGCESTSAVINVRTNFAPDPRMTSTAMGTYNGVGTLAAVTGISGGPDGITTAIRVTYAAGANNPGVVVMPLPDVNTQYTATAWVYNEGATSETIAIALKGFSSGGTTVVPQGVWTKLVWTLTTPGTLVTGNDFGVRIPTSAAAGSFLTTGVLIEKAPNTGAFFDGATAAAGDYTYAWSGTANASSSFQKAPNLQFWNPLGSAFVHQSTQSAVTGTKVGAIVTRGTASDGAYHSNIAVTSGFKFVWSGYIKLTSTIPSLTMVVRWKDVSDATLSDSVAEVVGSLVVGSWVRVSVSATAPANAVWAQPMVRAASSSTTIYMDALMFEASPVITPYFDGNTAAAGDFTYSWTATAHQSTSLMRVNAVSGVNSTSAIPATSTAWFSSGTRSIRIVPTSPGTSTDSFVAPGGDTGAMRLGMEAGKTYTVSATFRQDQVLTGTLRLSTPSCIQIFWKPAGGGYTSVLSTAKANAIGVERLSRTVTLPADAVEAFVRLYHGGQRGAGDIWVDDFMISEGSYQGDYVDGTKLFSKWDGTPNNSTSVGYSPQLFDIAGVPALELATIGLTANYPVADPFAARTIYFVYEIMDNTTNYAQYAGYGIANSSGINLQTGTAGSSSMSPRLDFPGGDVNRNLGAGFSQGRTVRRHVVAITFEQGLTTTRYCINGGTDQVVTTLAPGTGWSEGRLGLNTAIQGKGLRALAYYADHDRNTRLEISKFLGNEYGAAVG